MNSRNRKVSIVHKYQKMEGIYQTNGDPGLYIEANFLFVNILLLICSSVLPYPESFSPLCQLKELSNYFFIVCH